MATFQTYNHAGIRFSRNPRAVKALGDRGWAIQCHSEDKSLYGGAYTMIVGYADMDRYGHPVPFRLKRDAIHAIAQGEALGLWTSLNLAP